MALPVRGPILGRASWGRGWTSKQFVDTADHLFYREYEIGDLYELIGCITAGIPFCLIIKIDSHKTRDRAEKSSAAAISTREKHALGRLVGRGAWQVAAAFS